VGRWGWSSGGGFEGKHLEQHGGQSRVARPALYKSGSRSTDFSRKGHLLGFFVVVLVLVLCFETGSCHVILLPQPLECWNYRCGHHAWHQLSFKPWRYLSALQFKVF
jgi:hypothetical protein